MIIDGHCDTLTKTYDKKHTISNNQYCFNTIDADKYKPIIQMMAAYIDPKYKDGFTRANEVIDYYLKNKENTILITKKSDIEYVLNNNKIGVILTIENGKAIENNLDNIDILYSIGVRLMSINWNEDNLLGTGALTTSKNGLTKLGKEYVKRLEQKKIIIDISHSSEETFWDVMKNTEKTIVATHSCCYNLCNHPRNLKDDQIKEIAKRGGIVGICFCSSFLNEKNQASVDDIIKHISYVINLVGEDYVGIGTDFDGMTQDQQVFNLRGLKQMNTLVKRLKDYNYSGICINKIMGENWLRVVNRPNEWLSWLSNSKYEKKTDEYLCDRNRMISFALY